MNITLGQLQELEKNCMSLLNSTFGLISDSIDIKKSTDNIANAIRKIVLASELAEKQVICVSGLQGAGKTTMMKNFYGISDGVLDESTGRGERIPVFFCEKKECTEVKLCAVCLLKEGNAYRKDRIEINKEDFINAGKGGKLGDDVHVMYLEVQNPYKHFENESSTFMLLPGFEKKIDYWQELIDLSVQSSVYSIFVCDDTRLASYDNEELRKKITDKFGESVIYAISRSDLSGDENKEAKETLLERMKIAQGESDRVICVGAYNDSEKNEKWIEELKNSINKYCSSTETAIRNNAKYMGDVINSEIMPEISKMRSYIDVVEGDCLAVQLKDSKYLQAFDKIVKKRKALLASKLEAELNSSTKRSIERLEKIFKDEEEAKKRGVYDSALNKIRRTIFGENIDDIELARNRVDEALKDENNIYDFQRAFVKAAVMIEEDEKPVKNCKEILLGESDSETSIDIFGGADIPASANQEQQERINHIMHDVTYLLTKKNTSIQEREHKEVEETLRVIAELGTQYFAKGALRQVDGDNPYLLKTTIKADLGKLEISYEDIKSKIGSTEKVIWGTLGLTSIDLAKDGVLNAVPLLAEALSIPVAVAGGAAAAIIGGTVGVAVVQDINRLQRTEYSSAVNAIRSIKSQVKAKYLDAYDTAMDQIKSRIEDNLIKESGVNKKIFRKTNALIALNKIEDVLDDINREVNNNAYDIGNAFGR